MACSVAGITSDANVLIDDLRHRAMLYKLQHGGDMPCEQLVEYVCNKKQAYTQSGGKRPFGVSLLYAGWDRHHGFQLYQSDPSGNYTGWKATCIGANHQSAINLLKQEYKHPIALNAAKDLTLKVLSKTLDVKLAAEKIEMATLTRTVGERTLITILPPEEVTALIKKVEEEAAAAATDAPTASGSDTSDAPTASGST